MVDIGKQNKVAASTAQAQQLDTEKTESASVLKVGGELNISDYIQAVPLSSRTADDLATFVGKQRETTRTSLALWLVKTFGFSLTATFLLMGVAASAPKMDKTLIKDLVPLVITSQSTLLGVALGFYFGTKDK